MNDYDALLGIFSSPSEISNKLEIKFREKYLDVKIFSSINEVDLSKINYLIVNLLDTQINFNDVKLMLKKAECKVVVLFPLYVKPQEKYVSDSSLQDLIELNNNLGIILVPEILGNGVKYNPNYITHNLIMQSLLSDRVKIGNDSNLINSISMSKLIEVIVRETFSFGISGQKLALVGPRRGSRSFVRNYLGTSSENIIVTNQESYYVEAARTVSLKVDFSLRLAVNLTKNMFLSEVVVEEEKIDDIVLVPNKIKNKKLVRKIGLKVSKRILKLFLLFVAFMAIPLVLILISVFSLYISSKKITSNSYEALKYIDFSIKTITLSQSMSFNIPAYYTYSNLVYKSASLFKQGIELTVTGSELGSKIIGSENYDLSIYSDNISAVLDRIHTDIGFLQSDLNELGGFTGGKIKEKLFNSKIDVALYKNKIFFLKSLASRFSYLLGTEKPMKYLVIFQNNMELRPTGGFIGSFALITFDKGKLSEIVVNDVYSADGQLKGHVDPPEPIRVHLGEGGWFMRDSNWDPDFVDSALKVEWFLDKEIGTQVDGVFAIDLSMIKKLIAVTGPLNLTDFQKIITPDNLYQSTQDEVESNFFPGSIKKASFLTALSNQLLFELQTLKNDKYFHFIKEIYTSLEERHLQVYLHDLNAQESIDKLGYSGKIDMSTDCGLRCIEDKYSLIDANLGVNKSNFYITREQELKLNVSRQYIDHELLVTYNNVANQAVGNDGIYKSYTRLITPLNANITGIRIYNSDGSFDNVSYEVLDKKNYKEIGFLIKVLPSESKRIQIVWNLKTDKLNEGGELKLNVRKQAGTDNDKLTINLAKTDLTLTGRAPSVYTTTLDRDLNLKLFFK